MMTWLIWAFQRIGYIVRPYDMLADARRWCWQPRQQCGWLRDMHRCGVCGEPVAHGKSTCYECDEYYF